MIPGTQLPDLLETLAHELGRALSRCMPDMKSGDALALADTLIEAGSGAWGQRFFSLPKTPGHELHRVDVVYEQLYTAWQPVLTAAGMSHYQAEATTANLLHIARRLLGGHYVPKNNASQVARTRAERDQKIYADFNGNYRDVAVKYGLSETQVRSIVNRQLIAERRSRQRDLFSMET